MIDICNISLSYPNKETKALNDVSIHVKRNEIFGLIGPDGAGKTSLFRIILGLIKQNEGKVLVEDFDISNDLFYIRKICGYMPNNFSLYTDLTVEENLLFFSSLYNANLKKGKEIIHSIWKQIEPFKKRLAGDLSGGMKQKLALCCALINSPKILILDEPTTGVDAVSRKEFWDILKSLQDNDITIIVATPFMDEANLCDRIAFINNGEILEVNSPDVVIASYKKSLISLYSKSIFDLLNVCKNIKEIKGVYLFGQVLHAIIEEEDSIEKLLIQFQKAGFEDIIIKSIIPTIEDCFIEKMLIAKW